MKMTFQEILKKMELCHGELQNRVEELQNKYDDKEGDEPETDSEIKKWEEALTKFEESKEGLEELNERFEEIFSILTDLDENNIGACDFEDLPDLVQDYEAYNAEYRGITKQVQKLKGLMEAIERYDDEDEEEEE